MPRLPLPMPSSPLPPPMLRDPLLLRLEPMLSASRLREEDISADAASGLPDAVRDDLAMLRRWSYDRVQREAIATTLEQLADPS